MKWLKLVAVSVLVLVGAGVATGIGIVAGEQVGVLLGSGTADDVPQILVAYAVLFLYVFLVIMFFARQRRKALLRELAEPTRQFAVTDALAAQAAAIAQQLERHYALVRTHATSSFVASLAAAVAGFAIFLVAILTSDKGIAPAAAVGAAVSEFLAGAFFLLHRRADQHLRRVADDLSRGNARVLAAQIISQIKDQALKDEAHRQLVSALIEDADMDPAAWEAHAAATAVGSV
jgi:siroheme synthase (precorrin-2 oxidase/ferrochelatase)